MIRPLRRVHLVVWSALAVALPVGLLLALRARVVWPSGPAGDTPPGAVAAPTRGPEWSASWDELAIGLRLWSAGADGRAALELAPSVDLARPDVLVYWRQAAPGAPDGPPLDGHLLGTMAGTRARTFQLPESARLRDGQLVLYSLGHQEVVGTYSLAALEER